MDEAAVCLPHVPPRVPTAGRLRKSANFSGFKLGILAEIFSVSRLPPRRVFARQISPSPGSHAAARAVAGQGGTAAVRAPDLDGPDHPLRQDTVAPLLGGPVQG
ncbi:MAG: hypothetical protein LBT40_12325 [Deltaproteobacteria bacterium]|nr:hypothetical protein [Deltaproteobacteria bacterium]